MTDTTGKYEWNVRVAKQGYDFAEFIVSADTAKEAEAQIDPNSVSDEHWNGDGWEHPELYICKYSTERMDRIHPDLYVNPDNAGTMELTDYEHGFLMATSHYLHAQLVDTGWEGDEWMEVELDGKHYDFNFWREEDDSGTSCIAYATKMEKGHRTTDTNVFKRLW